MKGNRVLSTEEQLENIETMIMQYIDLIFNLMEEVLDLMEQRNALRR